MTNTIHVAITRQVKPGCEAAFETAILEFFADSLKHPGILGAQLLRPLPGSTDRTYGILRSFASEADRDRFYRSPAFAAWEEAVAPLVEGGYSLRPLHGLEAFFRGEGPPPRWKMALVTWLGVWPSVYLVARLTGRGLLRGWPGWLASGANTLVVVLLLAWVVMPLLTRAFRPWLASPHR
jgi:uncharacterized protein